jgi:hypothetical protein
VRECLWFAGAYPLSGCSGSGSRTWNASVQQNGEVTFWLVKLHPWRVSVEACEGATSIRDGGGDDWRHPIERLLDSYDRVGVTSQFESLSAGVVRVHLQLRHRGQQSGTTSAQSYDCEIRWHARETGSHDGLYAARVYWQDR